MFDNPVSVINAGGKSHWVLICEHAGRQIPAKLQQLGLSNEQLSRHIAYDIGAYEMTLALSKRLDATAVICHYSRLVIDCNRVLRAEDCIPPVSDDVLIPANQQLSTAARLQRIHGVYLPFHQTVSRVLADKTQANPHTKIGNIHSFTPMLARDGLPRIWDIGFIYRDPTLAKPLMDYFQQNTPHVVGDNQPYNGFIHKGYTIPAHADANDIPGFLVEFRQDHVGNENGVAYWADLMVDALHDL